MKKNDEDFPTECGFLKIIIISVNKEFKNILIEQNEDYLVYIKNEEESNIERIPNN